jgi:hypothetical protein
MIIDGMSSPNMMQVELAVNSKEECEKQFSVAYNDEYQLCTVPSSTKGTCQVNCKLVFSLVEQMEQKMVYMWDNISTGFK